MDELIKEAVERVRLRDDGTGCVTIDVPGYRRRPRLYTSAERVAWELARAFLVVAPDIGAWLISEELAKWRARAKDEIALALKKGDLIELDLERYLEETRFV
jgi:hypothetical protein